MKLPVLICAASSWLFLLCDAPAVAQTRLFTAPQRGGEAIYKSICQDCHMPDGRGAVGAGAYPALAGNRKLENAGYPISIIIHGLKGMPALGEDFTDPQIADVVNYIRTHFGNDYKGTVTPEEVKAAR